MQNMLAILLTLYSKTLELLLDVLHACSMYTCGHTQAKQVGKEPCLHSQEV